jgi:hypothetical protein
MAQTTEPIVWLSLVDVSGPFLAGTVLEEAFPQGLDKIETPRRQRLRAAYDEWQDAVDDNDSKLDELHAAWIRMVLEDCLEYDSESLSSREQLYGNIVYRPSEQGVEYIPDFAVGSGDGSPRLLIATYPPGTNLNNPLPREIWLASPAERMVLLCRAVGCRIGLVTNGEQWMLVNAPVGETSGYASWYSRLWWQEPVTLKAFQSLLGVRRCFGPDEETLPKLLERSLEFQEEVTNTLGEQVRRAVEVLIQSLGRADQDRNGELLKDVAPAQLYEAGLTVMMRLVFILSAEERSLLLLGDPIYDQHYAVSTLRAKLREDADQYGVEVLERRHDAWSRLLATFRAIYGGVEHEAMRLPALGGSLFDPDRFPFLEGRPAGSKWREEAAIPLPIDNRTVLLLMTALQVIEQRGGARWLSYRALDVEQIGHVYEGLLEFTAARVPEITLGLIGTKKLPNPQITLSELESLASKGEQSLIGHLKEITGRSVPSLRKALGSEKDRAVFVALVQACNGDEQLALRLLPFGELIRADSWGNILVYRGGTHAVVPGNDRAETGTHYTPRSLTEMIIEKTLESLVYDGPITGLPREHWKLKPSTALLDLKICDPAMGSGAFLVGVCRYLAERLLEAWRTEENDGWHISITGEIVKVIDNLEPLPKSLDDRLVMARRLIADRCLYGVDKNPLAVELAKLSIWLVTMSKNRPFTFLDHSLRCGDSLVGLSDIRQLEQFALNSSDSIKSTLFGSLTQIISNVISSARMQRTELERKLSNTVADIESKTKIFQAVQHQTIRLKYLADVILAAYWPGGRPNQLRARLQDAFHKHFDQFRDGMSDVQAATACAIISQCGCPTPFHWPIEFPEVFQRNNSGFDAVVGNPPFAEGKLIDAFKPYFSLAYEVTQANVKDSPASTTKINFVAVFAERVLSALRRDGVFGMVMPTPFLRNERYWRFRFLLVSNTRLLFVISFPTAIFASASVETCSIIGVKTSENWQKSKFTAIDFDCGVRQQSQRELAPVLRDRFRTIRVSATSCSIELMERLCEEMARIEDFYCSKDGINPGRSDFRPYLLGRIENDLFIPDAYPVDKAPLPHPLAAPEPYDQRIHKPTLRGSDFTAYSSLPIPEKYLRYDERIAYVEDFYVSGTRWSAQLREQSIYERPIKVVTRQTAPTLIATLDKKFRYPINNVHVHFPLEGVSLEYSCEFLLAIMNSRLLRFVYQAMSEETGNVFPQVHLSKVRQLPIPRKIPKTLSIRIHECVSEILLGDDSRDRVSEIDDCVFQLYDIDEETRIMIEDASIDSTDARLES